MIWLTELQKHCHCQEVIPLFSLPKQGRDFLYYSDFVNGTCSSELCPLGAVAFSR
jgi:hypothetical protein